MGTHFTTVDSIFFAHTLFYKCMPCFRHYRHATRLSHHINGVPA
ncbi:Uncharacterised protein [Vibrio cholerae]|nr:Uncharacterised protein [Vibrio cholerae]CSC90655.1 Uncharacterised protein [Vibrio cholerae]